MHKIDKINPERNEKLNKYLGVLEKAAKEERIPLLEYVRKEQRTMRIRRSKHSEENPNPWYSHNADWMLDELEYYVGQHICSMEHCQEWINEELDNITEAQMCTECYEASYCICKDCGSKIHWDDAPGLPNDPMVIDSKGHMKLAGAWVPVVSNCCECSEHRAFEPYPLNEDEHYWAGEWHEDGWK